MATAAGPATTQPPPHPVRLVVLLGALSAFAPLSIDMYLPAFPSLAADLHAGPSAVQLTLTACLVGLAAGQLVVGPLSDTLGLRKTLLVGLACYTVLSAACLVAPSVWALAGLRLLQGFGGSGRPVIWGGRGPRRRAGGADG